MYPKLIHIHGSVWIHSYGVMIAIGFLLFMYLTFKDHRRSKIIAEDVFSNTVFWGLLSGIIGGRIFFIIEEWASVKDNLIEMLYPWIPGFALQGSILAIVMILPIYLKIHKVKILPFLDLIATYAPLLQSISRIGCFLAGCCYGCPAHNLPWAITFTNPESLAPINIPLHPTQLYSCLASFLIFIVTLSLSRFKLKTGFLFFFYLFLESIARFSVDFWRGQSDLVSRYTALSLFFLSIFGLIYTNFKKTNNNL